MGKYRKFSDEYRMAAVRMVIDTRRPVARVVRDLGIGEGTLRNWVTRYRADNPASEELTVDERARLMELEGESRELRLEWEFPKKLRHSSQRSNSNPAVWRPPSRSRRAICHRGRMGATSLLRHGVLSWERLCPQTLLVEVQVKSFDY